MEGAKVTFTPEFVEKTKYKKLNRLEKGKLMKERFEAITPEQLSQVHSRNELAELLGYKKGEKAGNSYVIQLIKKGKIIEQPTGEIQNRTIISDYCFPSADSRSKKGLREIIKPVEKQENKISPKISIDLRDISITLENPTIDIISAVFDKIPFSKES